MNITKTGSFRLAIFCPVLAATLVAASGCTTGEMLPNRQVVRSSGDTAPADLQLACAAEAANQLGVSGDKVLPVSSMRTGDNVYQVNLTLPSGQAVCFIDSEGVVQSVSRV